MDEKVLIDVKCEMTREKRLEERRKALEKTLARVKWMYEFGISYHEGMEMIKKGIIVDDWDYGTGVRLVNK